MHHSVAVGAQQMQVCELGLCSRQKLMQWHRMVRLNEAVTAIPVAGLEIKPGRFTN